MPQTQLPERWGHEGHLSVPCRAQALHTYKVKCFKVDVKGSKKEVGKKHWTLPQEFDDDGRAVGASTAFSPSMPLITLMTQRVTAQWLTSKVPVSTRSRFGMTLALALLPASSKLVHAASPMTPLLLRHSGLSVCICGCAASLLRCGVDGGLCGGRSARVWVWQHLGRGLACGAAGEIFRCMRLMQCMLLRACSCF